MGPGTSIRNPSDSFRTRREWKDQQRGELKLGLHMKLLGLSGFDSTLVGWFQSEQGKPTTTHPYGCRSKPMVPFWGRCTTHFGLFLWGLGCSLGVRAFDSSQQASKPGKTPFKCCPCACTASFDPLRERTWCRRCSALAHDMPLI